MRSFIPPILLFILFLYPWPIVDSGRSSPSKASPTLIGPNSRVDCAPKRGEGKAECMARACLWDENPDKYHPSVPWCYFPPGTGYGIQQRFGDNNLTLKRLQSGAKNPYGQDFDELKFIVKQMGGALQITIGRDDRYIPPVPLNLNAQIGKGEKLGVEIFPKGNGTSPNEFFYFIVKRAKQPSAAIWDTSIGGLLFADQFIQIATFLPTERIYGFGENAHNQLKHDFSAYHTWGMYGRDQAPDSYTPNSGNLYGVHPFYVGIEPNGNAHGVLILNSNVQEITTGPSPHLIYRTIGGQLDIFFFPGPTPEQVVQQLQQLIGRPTMPAYWALGYQFSRYGYKSLDDMKQTIGRIRNASIPLDVVYADIDHMDRFKDFTLDPKKWAGLGDYVNELHQNGLKFVPIVDPAIEVDYEVFERARKANASFVEWERFDQVPEKVQELYPMAKDTKIMLGIVWPDKHVAFPDFLDPKNITQKWWADEIKIFHEKVPFDGIWIDMDEPSNFATNQQKLEKGLETLKCPMQGADSKFDAPAYQTVDVYQWGPGSSLSEKTLCLLGRTMRGQNNLFNTHSLYGWSEMAATRRALELATGKRGELLSRSTFIGSGYFGSHWTGDNSARWPDLRASSIAVMEFNIFGIPHMGVDVCGFNLPTNEELCLRWQQLGAFHPFFRNHNSDDAPDQDPTQWKSVTIASRAANHFRYQHLPYLYSLHFRASKEGGTVIRPLFFEFPNDFVTYELNYQFLWGNGLMVIPVLDPGVDTVRGYFPFGTVWYSISNAHKYGVKIMGGGFQTINAPRDTPLPAFLRAGTIIPKQKPALTVEEMRKNEFQLAIALDPVNLTANGELYWDDGEFIIEPNNFKSHPYYHFQFSMEIGERKSQLLINCTHSPPRGQQISLPSLSSIEVFGHPRRQFRQNLSINGRRIGVEKNGGFFEFNARKEYLRIEAKELANLNVGKVWKIQWK